MSISIVVSKIRCENPNKKNKTPTRNRNTLMYVATREGVDLTPTLSKDKDNDEDIYMRYIAERPRSHGLFGNLPNEEIDDLDSLCSQVYQLSKSTPIYKGILSLHEEDALLLGYDKKETWESALRATLPSVAEELNIRTSSLQWVAAFHQEKGHPHVHYMLWSNDDRIRSSFIHTTTQGKCREIFSKHIFEAERDFYVAEKTIARDEIIESGKVLIPAEMKKLLIPESNITGRMSHDTLSNLSKKLLEFCGSLPASGRLAYEFLPSPKKETLNYIIDDFLSMPPLKGKYDTFQRYVNDIIKSYSVVGEKKDRKMDDADYVLKKRLGNIILKEMKNFRLSMDPGHLEIDLTTPQKNTPEPDYIADDSWDENENLYSLQDATMPKSNTHFSMDWSDTYKKARALIYDDATDRTIEKGVKLLEKESATNNVLAIYELAHVCETGLFGDDHSWDYHKLYKESLMGFLQLYSSLDDKKKDYIAYRIGKQYMRGQGCDVDFSSAASWFENSSNQYAEYSLAKIYLNEDPSAPNAPIEKIVSLLQHSAHQGFGYANYQLGVLYESGTLIPADKEEAFENYKKALSYFISKSTSATDSSIFYRLGTMYYRGKGTEKNLKEATTHFEKAASLGNINALFSLSKIYNEVNDYKKLHQVTEKLEQHLDQLNTVVEPTDEQKNSISQIHYHLARVYSDKESPLFNFEHGLYYYQLPAASSNQFAQYQLGKVFSQDKLVARDLPLAISYFEESASQGNIDAQYSLGKLYADKNLEIYNLSKAIEILEPVATDGHSFSQYLLGKIFSDSEYDCFDIQKAICYFSDAADQNNEFAQYQLGKIYSDQESNYFDLNLALSFLHLAADQGNEQALYKLGTIYSNSDYNIYNIQTALMFYHRAINEYDNSYAKYQLGRMYLFGNGVEKNVILGMEYLKDASSSGNEYATALISFYQNSRMLYVSYSISKGMLNLLTSQIDQNRQHKQTLAHSTVSKKNRKEQAKKNQIKSEEPD